MKKQPLDIILEIIGIIAIIVSFVLPAYYYQDLPESLPRHFGSDGLPDAYGGKGFIWVLPVMGFFLFLIIGLISNIQGIINLPFKTSPEKMEFYQKKYGRMIRILNVAMVCFFALLTNITIQIGLGNNTQLPDYFNFIGLLVFFGIPLIYIIPDLMKAKKGA